jgi:paraquat-inducible protein A
MRAGQPPRPPARWAPTAPGPEQPPLVRRDDLVVCNDCEAVYPRRPLAVDAVVRCRRCGATLGRGHWLTTEGQLALTVAALVTFVIGSASPIVTLELRGLHSVATLFEATRLTWNTGEHLVAALAAATAFVFPLVVIALRLWVLLPMRAHREVLGLVPAMRALRWVMRWSMVEVFMLGVLIAVVRSAGVTSVVLGPGIFAYAGLTLLLTAIQATGLHGLWQQAEELHR